MSNHDTSSPLNFQSHGIGNGRGNIKVTFQVKGKFPVGVRPKHHYVGLLCYALTPKCLFEAVDLPFKGGLYLFATVCQLPLEPIKALEIYDMSSNLYSPQLNWYQLAAMKNAEP